nr:hypothetical protein OG781_37585 [Streptomyces sp. NBC_00830]
MLPDTTVPTALLAVLTFLRGCFTTPTFTTFAALVTGLIAQTGRCTVTGMLTVIHQGLRDSPQPAENPRWRGALGRLP